MAIMGRWEVSTTEGKGLNAVYAAHGTLQGCVGLMIGLITTADAVVIQEPQKLPLLEF